MACYVGKEGWNTGDVKWGKHLSSESSWSSGIINYYSLLPETDREGEKELSQVIHVHTIELTERKINSSELCLVYSLD